MPTWAQVVASTAPEPLDEHKTPELAKGNWKDSEKGEVLNSDALTLPPKVNGDAHLSEEKEVIAAAAHNVQSSPIKKDSENSKAEMLEALSAGLKSDEICVAEQSEQSTTPSETGTPLIKPKPEPNLEPRVGEPGEIEMIAQECFGEEFTRISFAATDLAVLHLEEAAKQNLLQPLARLQGALSHELPARKCRVFHMARSKDNKILDIHYMKESVRSCWDLQKYGYCPRSTPDVYGRCLCQWDHGHFLRVMVAGEAASLPQHFAMLAPKTPSTAHPRSTQAACEAHGLNVTSYD